MKQAATREKQITLITFWDESSEPKEERIGTQTVSFDMNGNIRAQPLVESLKKKGFTSLIDGHIISYFSITHDCFVYLGMDPLPANTIIPSASVN